jgi:hypothetical protein
MMSLDVSVEMGNLGEGLGAEGAGVGTFSIVTPLVDSYSRQIGKRLPTVLTGMKDTVHNILGIPIQFSSPLSRFQQGWGL